jgi:hypothetical protein
MDYNNYRRFFCMKNNLKLFLIAGLICTLIKAETPKRIEELRLEIQAHYDDIFAYSTGSIDPLNGHFPLDKRLMDWFIKAQQLSDEDKKELEPYVQQLDESLRNGIPGGPSLDTYRKKYTFANAAARIFCSLSGEQCRLLHKIHADECNTLWDEEQACIAQKIFEQ